MYTTVTVPFLSKVFKMFSWEALSKGVLVLLLVGGIAEAQDLLIRLNLPVINGLEDGTCPTGEQLQEQIQGHIDDINEIMHKGLSRENPASSCADVFHKHSSGYYWIQSLYIYNGSPYGTFTATQQYCDMDRTCCDSRGGWMRVANLDMTDPNQQCPSGFRYYPSERRSCGRLNDGGCVSTTFPVHGVEYSRVCGRVIGYQYGTPDGFNADLSSTLRASIDGYYVDGVSLTHSNSPRQHIWTFAADSDNGIYAGSGCPCHEPYSPPWGNAVEVPSFVGEDYFCESGSQDTYSYGFYTEDPLWDGQGCGEESTCCNHPLYFCKQLDQPTREDIELRVCGGSHYEIDEDSPLEIVEIYVQ